MVLKEEKRNLFEVGDKYYFAHCISSDCAMGAGIAVDFQKKFKLRNILLGFSDCERTHPTTIVCNGVFNLITKEKYWHKPTYQSLELCLMEMKRQVELLDVHYIAMPKIGCGLDRLQWGRVREIIYDVFRNVEELEILVCHI